MRVDKVMNPTVVACRDDETLARAAQLMHDHDVGCVLVQDPAGALVGLVTDRDVCEAAYERDAPLRSIPVRAAMSSPVATCRADSELESVEQEMGHRRVRRMPVVDDNGRAIGMLSIHDLARATRDNVWFSSSALGWTLAAICAPRRRITPH